jgi:hypothetical protein
LDGLRLYKLGQVFATISAKKSGSRKDSRLFKDGFLVTAWAELSSHSRRLAFPAQGVTDPAPTWHSFHLLSKNDTIFARVNRRLVFEDGFLYTQDFNRCFIFTLFAIIRPAILENLFEG